MSHAITTTSGLQFDYDNPTAAMISIDDVAVALGNSCRFAGHVRHYYSVAEHAMLVASLVRDPDHNPALRLAALHHDSHEAYLGDIPTPLKAKITAEAPGVWEAMTAAIDAAIAEAFDFDLGLLSHPAIRFADRQALGFEAACLKPEGTPIFDLDLEHYKTEAEARRLIDGLRPEDAAVDFADYHATMQRRRGR